MTETNPSNEQLAEMRRQVLVAALALAHRAVEHGESLDGASVIQLEDKVDVVYDHLGDGAQTVTWKLTAQWDVDGDVSLRGGPQLSEQPTQANFGPFLIFGPPEKRGQLAFVVPADWVKAAALAHDPRSAS